MVAVSPNQSSSIQKENYVNSKGFNCLKETITYVDGTIDITDYIFYDNIKYIQYQGWAQKDKHSIKYIDSGKLTARAKYPNENVSDYHVFVKKNHVHVGINKQANHDTFLVGEEFCIVTVNGVKVGFSESTSNKYFQFRNSYIKQLKSGFDLKH